MGLFGSGWGKNLGIIGATLKDIGGGLDHGPTGYLEQYQARQEAERRRSAQDAAYDDLQGLLGSGPKFTAQNALDFGLGGYSGLDRRGHLDAAAARSAAQSAAYDGIASLGTPQGGGLAHGFPDLPMPSFGGQSPMQGAMSAPSPYTDFIQGQSASMFGGQGQANAGPRMASREELFPKLFGAMRAGIDVGPLMDLYDKMQPKAPDYSTSAVGTHLARFRDDQPEPVWQYDSPAPPEKPMMPIRGEDGLYDWNPATHQANKVASWEQFAPPRKSERRGSSGGGGGGGGGARDQFTAGETYTDAEGNSAVYLGNGQWRE